jgi:hypothetical protein
MMKTWNVLWVLTVLTVVLAACTRGELRGSTSASPDGRTYLKVVDDNGGMCGPIRVDGKTWPHPKDKAGLIAPGTHTIECGRGGGKIEFNVPKGVVFSFDYWGP